MSVFMTFEETSQTGFGIEQLNDEEILVYH